MDIKSFKPYVEELITAPNCSVYCEVGLRPILDITSKEKNIIFFAWDHAGVEFTVLPPTQRQRSIIEDLKKKVLENPDQTFWIFHAWLHFELYFNKIPANLKLIKYTDDFSLHGPRTLYSTISPQSEKNLDSTKHWISLGANRRIGRYIAALYLLGSSATQHGLLKLDPTEIIFHESWDSYLSYWKYNECNEIFSIESSFPILKEGFYKMKNGVEYETRIYNPANTPPIEHKNFDEVLRIMYRDSFVEIVNETLFLEKSGQISEKFLNSVYGYNFPIILNVPGAVEYMRSIGFDMFDDVINHSYDTVVDPFPRLVKALGDNIELLKNSDIAKSAWVKCQHRMKKNVELMREFELGMPDHVTKVLTALNLELSK